MCYDDVKTKKSSEDNVLKKKEKIFIAALLLLAGILSLLFSLTGRKESASIRICVDGEEYGIYSLSEDQVISIGDTNICEIKDGHVSMIEATCPDHLCMKQRPIDENGGTIVCLPNKVIIEGEKAADSDGSQPEIDAAT
ncbi:MAG: NusG domain II-containing protein [Eubacteriales bacterium]|nr:NusG domain II-containing protein [Eubacteriales bacterium]